METQNRIMRGEAAGLPRWAGRTAAFAFLACAMAIAACSSSKETTKAPDGDTKTEAAKVDKKSGPPGADKDYPNLATVPDKKPDTSTSQQRIEIQEGLLADRTNARHVDGPVAGQSSRSTSLATTLPTDPVKREVITPPDSEEIQRRILRERRQVAVNAWLRQRNNPLRVRRGGYVTTVRFAENSSSLPPGSGKVIVQVAQLYSVAGGRIRIIGQGMSTEAATANARAVANGLVQLGIQANRIGLVARNGSGKSKKSEAAIYFVGSR